MEGVSAKHQQIRPATEGATRRAKGQCLQLRSYFQEVESLFVQEGGEKGQVKRPMIKILGIGVRIKGEKNAT